MLIKKFSAGNSTSRISIFGNLLLALFFFCITSVSQAQCAMCRAALEGEGNKATAEAVNDGIVYLMIIPYVLVGVIIWFIYKTGKKN